MPVFKRIIILLLLCNSVCFYALGQKPVIIPKTNPILPLNGNGQYTIQPGDIATYPPNTDSSVVVSILPESVDCDLRGSQQVHVKALSNGGAPGSAGLGVGFPGAISGLAYDTKGNLYVTELRSYSVRKISPDGNVTIFAGVGERGGTDGLGNIARFGGIFGIVTDKNDNVYVSDFDNNSIRKITPDGTVSTFAGTGFRGGNNGPGNKATFNFPHGLDIDADGNIYVADFGNRMIRKITPEGVVSTYAETYTDTYSVAAGPDGYIYWTSSAENINDPQVNGIFRAKPGGQTELYVGSNDHAESKDGTLTEARFGGIYGLKFGPGGNLFAIDFYSIRRISPDGVVSTFQTLPGITIFLTVDPCQNLVVSNEETIKRVTLSNQVSIIAAGNFNVLTGKVPASLCRINEADIPVTVQSKPTLPVIENKTVTGCATLADYTLHLATTDNCPGATVTYTQSPAAGTPFNDASPVTVIITATDNTGGTDSKTFTVTNTSIGVVTPSVTVTAVNNAVCEGEQASFHATVTNGDAGTEYQWQINGVNAGTNSPDFITTALHNNDVVNCIVTTGGGCGVPNMGSGVQIMVNPKPGISLKPAEQILAGTSINLNPAVTGNIVSYKWEPSIGLSDANSQYPAASPETTTTYKLTATTDQGCYNDASVTITVAHRISIPNTFTPNADGYNDIWDIKYLDAYTNCTINVYTRNGALVYHSKGYHTAWNGTSNGKTMPAGVYYYTIDLGDGSAILSGNVSILK